MKAILLIAFLVALVAAPKLTLLLLPVLVIGLGVLAYRIIMGLLWLVWYGGKNQRSTFHG